MDKNKEQFNALIKQYLLREEVIRLRENIKELTEKFVKEEERRNS